MRLAFLLVREFPFLTLLSAGGLHTAHSAATATAEKATPLHLTHVGPGSSPPGRTYTYTCARWAEESPSAGAARRLPNVMAAELSDMAEPPAVSPPFFSFFSSSASPSGGGAAEEAAESEAASVFSSSSSSSSFTSAAGVEAEPLPAALNGEGAESMSEPSPASQAGDGDDEEEEDGDDEEEDDDDEEDDEEAEAGSSSGSSSGCCTDDARSLSPGCSEADVKGDSGGAGVGAGGGPNGSSGCGGDSSEAAAPQAAAAVSEVDAGTGSSGGAAAGADDGYATGSSSSSSSCSATSGGRRGSLEISSDGEPLSRMDSEDSISSTIMDVDSTISSGRSTPVMMNGQGVTTSSAKSIAYNCCWDQCHSCFNSSPDLADHIRSIHVDGQRGGVFVCLWKGCKVYNTPSTSQSWLQRHMLTHSGDKPFKCVVGGCNASFASQSGLARHVPTHFSQQNSSKVTNQPKAKEESPSKAGMNKRKKLKNKRRRSLPRPHDFFDTQTLDAIRHRAICFNLSAHIESLGKGHSVVFHSTVIAKRKEDSGKVKLLLHWTPEDILPDVWVNESERHQLKTKVVHLSKLPKDTALLLDPNIYRKSSKGGTFSGILKDHCS
ncbi:zinc finger protein AEBP2 isoform X3 [Ahaetulla prasina]|uniref:zinc finger protein AEBP2 isoform X3 n=1 Tax=Ahaetulla prasina TaxID=499056 RepID=UPI0026496358|nr:zinc finger protein AEBP2 isoform X3 [Ahaetulla prasina]